MGKPNSAAREPAALWMSTWGHRAGGHACGPGCSEWIAVEGPLRRGSRQLVSRIPQCTTHRCRRSLRVFFHSPGRTLSSGVEIATGDAREQHDGRCWEDDTGRLPPYLRPQAGALATCRSSRAMTCRRSSRLRAPSVTRPAYSPLAGATTRRIAPQAAVGVHASKSDERAWKKFVEQASRRAPAERRAAPAGITAGFIAAAQPRSRTRRFLKT